MATETAEQPTYKVTDSGDVLVPLKLAHPFGEKYAERVRAEEIKNYEVGDTIWVTREWGNALIDAGRVQVDPVDHKARQEALLLNRRRQPLTVKEIEAKLARVSAQGDGEGSEDGKPDVGPHGERSDADVSNDGDADASVAAKVNEAPTKGKTAAKAR